MNISHTKTSAGGLNKAFFSTIKGDEKGVKMRVYWVMG
jgi:hypothetical protein